MQVNCPICYKSLKNTKKEINCNQCGTKFLIEKNKPKIVSKNIVFSIAEYYILILLVIAFVINLIENNLIIWTYFSLFVGSGFILINLISLNYGFLLYKSGSVYRNKNPFLFYLLMIITTLFLSGIPFAFFFMNI